MRLDKYLAETAQCTRSEAKALLSKGRVQVNGAVCKKGDTQLKESDTVAVDGKALNYQQFVYLMLNKPEGVVSASTDKRDTTVVDLVGDAYPRRQLFPAGRLDKTSTGFVLLTDDGTFAHEILAPKRHVSKTYTVVLDTPLTEEMRTGFAAGVTLADGTALSPAEVTALSADGLTVRVVLRQGVYHQIKRMFGVYGAGVNGLHRDAIGGLALDAALAPGQWRELSAEEVWLICCPLLLYPKKGNTMTTPTFDTIEAQASYGIGLQVGQQLSESGLQGLLPEALVAGIADALEGKHPAVPVDVVHRALREIHERADAVRRQRFQAMAAEGVKYLEENAKKEGVNSTESGLQFRVINQGEGAIPARTDRVRVHYTGKLIDGTVFDSSVARGEPAEFPVNGVIPGWIEALTLMPVGSKWELTIPQELAYGERGAGASIPPFSTLVFEVELLEIL